MNSLQSIYNSLENEFYLFDDYYKQWNLNYFEKSKNRYTHSIQIVKKYYDGGKILEIGSAPFHLTYCLKKMKYPIVGVDISPERLNDFITKNSLNILKCNIENEKLPYPDNSFRFILFLEVFEHMRIDPISTLLEINRVLHPEGVLLISLPNLYSLPKIINYLRGKGFDCPYDEFNKIHKLGHMGHVRDYSIEQMKHILTKTGFKIENSQYKSYTYINKFYSIIGFIRYLFPKLNSVQIHLARKAPEQSAI